MDMRLWISSSALILKLVFGLVRLWSSCAFGSEVALCAVWTGAIWARMQCVREFEVTLCAVQIGAIWSLCAVASSSKLVRVQCDFEVALCVVRIGAILKGFRLKETLYSGLRLTRPRLVMHSNMSRGCWVWITLESWFWNPAPSHTQAVWSPGRLRIFSGFREIYHMWYLQLKTIENSKKNLLVLWYLQLKNPIENTTKPMCFWYLQLKTIENSNKPMCFLFTIKNHSK